MKELKLKADSPFHNSVDVAIFDFPNGKESEERQRCKITVEFAEIDVRTLMKQGMNKDEILKHYEDWIYQVVKLNLADDWKPTQGYDEVMDIVKSRVELYV